jgi:predicted metal-dependent phosphoesterase TrpH
VELDAVGDFIRNEPVVAVLAHPAAGSFPGEGHYKEVLPPVETVEQLLPEFLAAGVQGLEVYYPGHTMEHQALLTAWARQYDLLVTGGSDCHDATERPPGVCGIKEVDYLRLKAALNQCG